MSKSGENVGYLQIFIKNCPNQKKMLHISDFYLKISKFVENVYYIDISEYKKIKSGENLAYFYKTV